MIKTTRITALCIIFIMLLSSFSYPSLNGVSTAGNEIELISSTDNGLTIKINVDWRALTTDIVNTEEGMFTEVFLPGWQNSNQPGTPSLPFLTQAFGVPYGVDLGINVISGRSHSITLPTPILPSVSQVNSRNFRNENPDTVLFDYVVEPDALIYEQAHPYPNELVEITNDGTLRQQRVASLGISPVQYEPLTNSLKIIESLVIEVVFEGTPTVSLATTDAESDIYEALFESQLVNYQQAKRWRLNFEDRKQFANDEPGQVAVQTPKETLWLPPDPGWRVVVRQDGFYRLTYDALATAGLPVDAIDPQTFQMFYQGEEIGIQVSGEMDGVFDPIDTIIFYGQAIDSKYTADNVYWLSYGNQAGLRMDVRDGTPRGNLVPTHYSGQLQLEENNLYRSILPGQDELERFYWDYVYTAINPMWSQDFTLEEPYDGAGTLQIALFGSLNIDAINPDHHAIISLNGTQIADVEWDGLTWANDGIVEAEIPAGVLQPGVNTLTVFLPNDTGVGIDFVFVDWAKVLFANTFSTLAGEDYLAFSYDAPGTWKFQVSGFRTNDLSAYDVSDPLDVAVIDKDTLIIEFSGSDYQVSFEDEIVSEKKYWVIADSTIQTISAFDIVENLPSNLQSTAHRVDYILITHPAFLAEAETLATYRSSHGLDTLLVNVQDIYDEFSFGVVSPTAIRDFLYYAANYWQAPAPTYVLLFGDGHYDPKNHFGTSSPSYIPPYLAMADPWIGETAADNRYVAFSGPESIPEMILGRMPVNSNAQASAMVAKIIAYEQTPVVGNWTNEVLAVAGIADSAGDFAEYSDRLIADTLPNPYQAEKIHFGVTHTDIVQAVAALKSGINSGKLIVNFIGHGFSRGWSAQKNPPKIFIQTADVAGFTNQDKYPIFLAMTCSEGYFIDPTVEAFGEAVTLAENKGAIASWSPTGQGVSGAHDYLDRGFFDAVYKQGSYVLGEAILNGFSRLWFSGSSLYLMETYELFGDPALKINRTPAAVDDFYTAAEDFSVVADAENGVLKNDFGFAPGNDLTASLETDVTYGQLDLAADGSFAYAPAADWFGEDEFTYSVFDGEELIGIATATINVHSINDAPVAYPQTLDTWVNSPVELILTGSDVDDDSLTYVITRYPEHGLLTPNNPPGPEYLLGQNLEPGLIYQPDAEYYGIDSFEYVVNDGNLISDPAMISIRINLEGEIVFLPLVLR